MNCKNCGAPLPTGARFCKKCGTEVPAEPVTKARPAVLAKLSSAARRVGEAVKKLFRHPIFHNKKQLLMIGGGAAALLLALILILSIASCRPKKAKTPEDVADAVLSALESGDGKALAGMASLSEKVCGAHPEVFGTGDTPHAVMSGYYRELVESHHAQWKERYGKNFRLSSQLTATYYTDTEVFEINRALEIDAAQYAVMDGPLLVNDEAVGSIRITVVEWGGAWQLLVVYLY